MQWEIEDRQQSRPGGGDGDDLRWSTRLRLDSAPSGHARNHAAPARRRCGRTDPGPGQRGQPHPLCQAGPKAQPAVRRRRPAPHRASPSPTMARKPDDAQREAGRPAYRQTDAAPASSPAAAAWWLNRSSPGRRNTAFSCLNPRNWSPCSCRSISMAYPPSSTRVAELLAWFLPVWSKKNRRRPLRRLRQPESRYRKAPTSTREPLAATGALGLRRQAVSG